MKNIILLLTYSFFSTYLYAQGDSSSHKKSFFYNTFHKDTYGKNTIRYNPVPTAIFENSKNAAIGYERVLKNNQSISANFGFFFLPELINGQIGAYNVHKNSEFGIITSLDYRFYLKNLNTRPAPNGVYIGPYYSMYYHKGDVDISYADGSGIYTGNLKNSFALYNFGFQLGYQFIFYKRISLDMVLFGPSVSFYDIEMDITTGIPPEKAAQLREKYYNSFFAKYPAFEQLFTSGSFKSKGASTGLMPGFRYLIQIGYHF